MLELDARYSMRAWERFDDAMAEVAVVDTVRDDTVLKLVEQNRNLRQSGLREGQMYFSPDPKVSWERGGHGANLKLIMNIDEESVEYYEFMGENDNIWREARDPRSTFYYLIDHEETLRPLTVVERPASRVLPNGVEYHPNAGLTLPRPM